MLEFLWGKVNERKLRLFACACCHRLWHDEIGGTHRTAAKMAELYADGLISRAKLMTFHESISPHPPSNPRFVTSPDFTHQFSEYFWGRVTADHSPEDQQDRAALFRHIIGNPFRPYPAPPSWPSTVVQLAQSLYAGQDCAFALHDALLEAGHAELAEHLREEKSHPKGCWVVDLILGKE
jgi:hypothetical protein